LRACRNPVSSTVNTEAKRCQCRVRPRRASVCLRWRSVPPAGQPHRLRAWFRG
jgi:hypothetical protein